MNIFYIDRNIQKCAEAHCDKHVNKMILEGAQLLASAQHLTNPDASMITELYKLTHKNHPDAIWVRSSINHYLYLMDLMEALNEECKYRYEHNKDHISWTKVLNWPYPPLPDLPFVEPPKCVHDDFKGMEDTVEAYREYYKRDKREIASWSKRQPPDWF